MEEPDEVPNESKSQQESLHNPLNNARSATRAAPVLIHDRRSTQDGTRPASSRQFNRPEGRSDSRYESTASANNYGQESDAYDSRDSMECNSPKVVPLYHRSATIPSVPPAPSRRIFTRPRETRYHVKGTPKSGYPTYAHSQHPPASRGQQPTNIEHRQSFEYITAGDLNKRIMHSSTADTHEPTRDLQPSVEEYFTDESEEEHIAGASSASTVRKEPRQNPSYTRGDDPRWQSVGLPRQKCSRNPSYSREAIIHWGPGETIEVGPGEGKRIQVMPDGSSRTFI